MLSPALGDEQKMHFLALALPFFLAHSDPLPPSSLLLLAISQQTQNPQSK